MKELLKILSGGLVLFLALAMIQEREVFLPLLPGVAAPVVEAGADAEREEAAKSTVRHFLDMLAHLYRSDGDPRFAERLPAAPLVVDEVMGDIAYLQQNHRRQEPTLMRLEVLAVEPAGPAGQRVRSREYWVIRTLLAGHQQEVDPPRSEVLELEYLLALEGQQWQVLGWDLAPPPMPVAEDSLRSD